MSRSPRVLLAPIDVANQLARSAHGLREVGWPATCFAPHHVFGYDVQPDVVPPLRRLPYVRAAAAALRRHDVLHLGQAGSLLREPYRGLDARCARALGKRVVMEFFGSDVRMPSIERERNPHYVQLPGEDDERATVRMRRWASITDGHAIVCDHSLDAFLTPYFPHVHVVGQRVDTRRLLPRYPDPAARVPVIVHSPSNVAGKGTRFVRAAIEQLRADGVPHEYVEINGVEQGQALAAYRRADLIVDQLCAGSHGVFAAEAMSLGKPVVCYLLPELLARYPADLPLIPATPDTLVEVLDAWLRDPAGRAERGRASRDYAERVHDVRVVARKLADVYEVLPR